MNSRAETPGVTQGRKPARSLRREQKEATRRRLVDAGIEIFTERGYQAATVEEITDRAQVGRTTFYTHFQGKAEVAFAVASEQTSGLNQAVSKLGVVDPRDPAAVSAWLDDVEAEFLRNRVAATLVIQAVDADTAAASHFVQVQFQTAQKVIDRLVASGRSVSNDAHDLVRLVLMLVNRWMFAHIVQGAPGADSSREPLRQLIVTQLDRCIGDGRRP